ncbi:LysM peptidoglycan-binding domain-containing protein [Bacillus sp. APMAM]|nr:LysM peptidoglycan-binding domain-containing protein [Bacillus sp. APMAM]
MDGAKNTKQFKVIKHVVQPGETLFTIAMKYYHSRDGEEIIQKYNHLTNTTVYFGTTLQIPLQTK